MMFEIDKKYLLAVEAGELDRLRELFESSEIFDKNCCDPLGRNALVIAIDNRNLDLLKLLIEMRVRLGDALLYAIDENYLEAVELLLDYEQRIVKTGALPSSSNQLMDSTAGANSQLSRYSADMTPLILAAHKNSFEVIKILLDRNVSPILEPHDPRCDCKPCQRARSEDCLRHSHSRINAYRALASPGLMALSNPDPLLVAFKLSARLENLAKMEPEYKQDYLKLRIQCQTFATKLLDHTRTSQELEILLNYSNDDSPPPPQSCLNETLYESALDSVPYSHQTVVSAKPSYQMATLTKNGRSSTKDSTYTWDSFGSTYNGAVPQNESYKSTMRLSRLKLAIQCKQKTFCAHPNIQELLATMWYENLPGFRRKSFLAQAIQVICIGLMFPIYSIAYLLAPQTRLGGYIRRPFIKFICHSASYITFLLLIILASQRVEAFYCWNTLVQLFTFSSGSASSLTASANLTLLKQAIRVPLPPAPSTNFDDADINTLAALYKQLGSAGPASSPASTARGLDSLSKIFEEMPASAKKRGTLPSPIEVVIFVWVGSLIWAELKQLRALGMNYYRDDMWNILDSVASGFYIGAITLRFVSYLESDEISRGVAREHWPAYDPLLLSEGLFAAATIFSALKLVYIFSVNPYLGPLQISLGRMFVDIVRFSWIYMLVLFAFACGMNQLLWYYADLERHQCLNVTSYSLAQYYSSQHTVLPPAPEMEHPTTTVQSNLSSSLASNISTPLLQNQSNLSTITTTTSTPATPPILENVKEDDKLADERLMEAAFSASLEDDSVKPPVTIDGSCKTWRHFSNVFESTQTLFWANFGLVDLENFDLTGIRQYTRFWALLMFGCYCFINVIVVLNLLIAMMNHSYVKISKRSDIEWKFARTRLWMSYFDTGSTVPVPFNIFPSIKSIVGLFVRCCPRDDCLFDQRQRSLRDTKYYQVVQLLVRRYVVAEQRSVGDTFKLTESKLNRWISFKQMERFSAGTATTAGADQKLGMIT